MKRIWGSPAVCACSSLTVPCIATMASHEPLLYGSTDAGGGYQSAAAGGEEAMASPSAPASSSSPPAVHPQAQAQPYESIAMGHESRPVAAGKHRDGAVAAGGASDGFVSAASVPLDAHLFSCEVLNGQGGPHAKSWLWISRDQICVGVAQYPVLSIWARIKHFLWLLLCCGCCQVPSKAGWRDGQPWRDDDEEDEEAEGEKIEEAHSNLNAGPGVGLPPRLRREASLLVFSSRVDYLSVSSFKAVKERLRYSLPTVWTQWFSPLEFGQWVWHLVKSVANFVFGMEIGWVLVSIGLCIGCICHGAHAAGLYGNPDSFKHGVYWMTALWFFTIGALVYHFEVSLPTRHRTGQRTIVKRGEGERAGQNRASVCELSCCAHFCPLCFALAHLHSGGSCGPTRRPLRAPVASSWVGGLS